MAASLISVRDFCQFRRPLRAGLREMRVPVLREVVAGCPRAGAGSAARAGRARRGPGGRCPAARPPASAAASSRRLEVVQAARPRSRMTGQETLVLWWRPDIDPTRRAWVDFFFFSLISPSFYACETLSC